MRKLLKKIIRFIVSAPCPDCNGTGFRMRERGTHAYCFNLCTLCRGTRRV